MTIKTRVMKGKKQTPMYMFERMVQKSVEEQTGDTVYASGLAYNETSEMWYFKCETLNCKGDVRYTTYEGYIGMLGKVVITKANGQRLEVA